MWVLNVAAAGYCAYVLGNTWDYSGIGQRLLLSFMILLNVACVFLLAPM